MYNSIAMSLGEMVLKGKNRGVFEQQLNRQIQKVISKEGLELYRDRGKVFVDTNNPETVVQELTRIFGIVYVTPCMKIVTDMDEIEKKVVDFVVEKMKEKPYQTFKVQCNRGNKSFPIKSPEMSKRLGAVILKNTNNLTVDVHHPELMVYVDIRTHTYIYSEKIKGAGGLPIGSNGHALVLLSGGIDSPVAAYMVAKRGVRLTCITFHAYPFTSQRANDKVKELTQQLTTFCGDINLYSVNLLEVYKAIRMNCKEEEATILARRFMMRIAEKVAQSEKIDFLVTGESLGQVASQTAQSLKVVDATTNELVLRPLIGMDKTEIINIAKGINTYEIAIQPYEDCCSVFSPNHPLTKPKIDRIETSERKLAIEELVREAIDSMEKERLN
jgi:thiamine biosynthesis protein ThiI